MSYNNDFIRPRTRRRDLRVQPNEEVPQSLIIGLVSRESKLSQLQEQYDSASKDKDTLKMSDTLKEINEQTNDIKNYLRTNKAPDSVVGIYFDKDATALSEFKGDSGTRVIGLLQGLPKGRVPRNLLVPQGIGGDFEFESGKSTAGKGMDALQQSGNLDPAQIEKIASILEGQGARAKQKETIPSRTRREEEGGTMTLPRATIDTDDEGETTIDDLMDELDKGNSIDYQSLSKEQQHELRERMQSRPAPTKKTDFTSGEQKGRLPTDMSPIGQPIVDKDLDKRLSNISDPEQTEQEEGLLEIAGSVEQSLQHEHEAAEMGHATHQFSRQDDMIPFSQPNYEIENPGFFAKAASYTAEVVRDKVADVAKVALGETAEGFVDQLAMVSGLGEVSMIVKEPVKKVLRDFIDNKVDNTVKPMRPLMDGKQNSFAEKELLDPALYPFVVLSLEFYIATLSETFEAPNLSGIKGGMVRMYLEQVMDAVGLSEADKKYAIYIISKVPNELLVAFRRNVVRVTEVTEREKTAIVEFVNDIIMEYEDLYGRPLFRDLEKEHAGDTLFELLGGLSSPNTLHLIASSLKTVDTLLYDVTNNDGLLLSLMALMAQHGNKDKLMNEFNFMHNIVEGLVYYDRSAMKGGLLIDTPKDVELLIEAQEQDKPVQMKEVGDDVYIVFRGVKIEKKDEFIQNILQKASSEEVAFNPKFNKSYQEGLGLLERAKKIARQKGGEVKIIGYSMGSYPAMYLSLNNPDIETNIYNPYFSKTPQTRNVLSALRQRESDIKVHTVDGDPISVGVGYYKDLLNIQSVKQSKYFNAHDLRNYVR